VKAPPSAVSQRHGRMRPRRVTPCSFGADTNGQARAGSARLCAGARSGCPNSFAAISRRRVQTLVRRSTRRRGTAPPAASAGRSIRSACPSFRRDPSAIAQISLAGTAKLAGRGAPAGAGRYAVEEMWRGARAARAVPWRAALRAFHLCETKRYPFWAPSSRAFSHCSATLATTALNFDPLGGVRAPNLRSIMAFLENATSLPRAITFEYTDQASP